MINRTGKPSALTFGRTEKFNKNAFWYGSLVVSQSARKVFQCAKTRPEGLIKKTFHCFASGTRGLVCSSLQKSHGDCGRGKASFQRRPTHARPVPCLGLHVAARTQNHSTDREACGACVMNYWSLNLFRRFAGSSLVSYRTHGAV